MDDPIFDPWPIEEASPGADAEPSRAPETPTPTGTPPPPTPAAPPSRWRSTTTRDVPARRPAPAPAPQTAEPDPVAERLRAIALPRLEALATRLEVARHRTLLDDRLARAEQVLRFRLMPWQAPFDVASAVPGSVLELAVEDVTGAGHARGPGRAAGTGDADGSRVAARFWLDPVATTPAEETLIDARRLTDAWLEGVLLDFVGRSLGRL